ncbi:MAG TPA: hypothetical protein VKT20_03970 [Candidatus Dormibacteraeota bacterium]|nr:hypothetical protein [Candidatus Dormibacteraeota bacterium]
MCLNCGCGEYNERHKPTDITMDDLKAAAEGHDMDVAAAADNISRSARMLRRRDEQGEEGEQERKAS